MILQIALGRDQRHSSSDVMPAEADEAVPSIQPGQLYFSSVGDFLFEKK